MKRLRNAPFCIEWDAEPQLTRTMTRTPELMQQPLSCAYVSAICVLTVVTVVQLITLNNFLSVVFIYIRF